MIMVALDGYTLNPGDNPWTDVATLGELVVYDRTDDVDLIKRAVDAEVLIVNKAGVDRRSLAALPKLKFVTVTATGYDIVDVEAARERGVPVSNVPEYGTDSVAQHAIALLLELTNRVGEHDASVREGGWIKTPDFSYWNRSILELAGRTLGVVGLGRIGRRVARIAAAFGMTVIAAKSAGSSDEKDDVERVELDEVFRRADVVSLHCPLNENTRSMVDRSRINSMKPSAFLINTSRGALVVEDDLVSALRSGRIAGAAIDVLAVEPMRPEHPYLSCPNLIVTPHQAWSSIDARRRLMKSTADNIRSYVAGRPINVVNP